MAESIDFLNFLIWKLLGAHKVVSVTKSCSAGTSDELCLILCLTSLCVEQ